MPVDTERVAVLVLPDSEWGRRHREGSDTSGLGSSRALGSAVDGRNLDVSSAGNDLVDCDGLGAKKLRHRKQFPEHDRVAFDVTKKVAVAAPHPQTSQRSPPPTNPVEPSVTSPNSLASAAKPSAEHSTKPGIATRYHQVQAALRRISWSFLTLEGIRFTLP